jgi:hypothetical protein
MDVCRPPLMVTGALMQEDHGNSFKVSTCTVHKVSQRSNTNNPA